MAAGKEEEEEEKATAMLACLLAAFACDHVSYSTRQNNGKERERDVHGSQPHCMEEEKERMKKSGGMDTKMTSCKNFFMIVSFLPFLARIEEGEPKKKFLVAVSIL